MTEKCKLFIFDLDGTLVDSVQQITNAINSARVEGGYSTLDGLLASSLIGLPATELVADLNLINSESEKLIIRFRELLLDAIQISNHVFPGVLDFLNESRERGILLGVATSKPDHIAQKVVENSELNGYFFHVQGTENFPGKPNPEVIKRVLEASGSNTAIMFGDRVEDIFAASAAGIGCVGIAQGPHSKEQLDAAGAFRTYSDFNEANEIFKFHT